MFDAPQLESHVTGHSVDRIHDQSLGINKKGRLSSQASSGSRISTTLLFLMPRVLLKAP